MVEKPYFHAFWVLSERFVQETNVQTQGEHSARVGECSGIVKNVEF
jgi:hypothetical protein